MSRKRDSLLSFNFEVASQTQQRKYVVRLSKTCMLPLRESESNTPVRDQISCGCPGYTVTLKKQNEDHVCKHCGAVLLALLKANRRVPLALADVPLPRARSPVRKAAVKALPQATFAGMMVDRRVTEPGAGCIGYGEHRRRRDQLGKLKALEDVQSCEPGLVPAADAVNHGRKKGRDRPLLFEQYEETAEEASELLPAGGRLLALMSAKQAQKMALYLLEKAQHFACLTAYTLDLLVLTEALVQTSMSGVQVQVLVDRGHSLKGTTSAQMERLDALRKKGVEVFLSRGVTSGGIQHSKTLYVDHFYIVGSTNWTSSSRSNHEMSVLLKLEESGIHVVEKRLAFIREVSTKLTQEEVTSSLVLRENRRSKSVEPDKFRTAKRFSIARARSMERG